MDDIFGIQDRPYTKLMGVKGEVKLNGQKSQVNYFMTTVSNFPESHEARFLQELKPLRERISMSSISNLDDILQRDINDRRVARDMIPYLIKGLAGEIDQPTFFPSIVALLIPKKVFGSDERVYPSNRDEAPTDNGSRVSYEDLWRITSFQSSRTICQLEIDFDNVWPIIIDGQHRAHTFKMALGGGYSEANEIYKTFYNKIDGIDSLSEAHIADLPVTLVWFDALDDSEHIDIREYARNIFVKINQSSQEIAKSRKVLLDSSDPSNYASRVFYDHLAKYGSFSTNNGLSLFHSGFDFPYNASARKTMCLATLFTPEFVSYAFSWLFFSPIAWSSNFQKHKAQEHQRRNPASFEKFLGRDMSNQLLRPDVDIDSNVTLGVVQEKASEYRKLLTDRLIAKKIAFIEASPFYRSAIRAWEIVAENIESDAPGNGFDDPHYQTAWKRIFKGGEGLYYQYDTLPKNQFETHRQATSGIEEAMRSAFSEELDMSSGDVKKAIVSCRSIAFYVGVVMAFSRVVEVIEDDNYDNFLDNFRGLDQKKFLEGIAYLKSHNLYFDSVDAKAWPQYRNYICRFIHSFEDSIYNDVNEDCLEVHLYQKICSAKLSTRCDASDPPMPYNLIKDGLNREDLLPEDWKDKDDYEEVLADIRGQAEVEVKEILEILGISMNQEFVRNPTFI